MMKWTGQIALFFCLCFASLNSNESGLHHGGPNGGGQYDFKGMHYLASYCECDTEALSNVEALAAAMLDATGQSGATILDSTKWVFPPNGLTMVILLSESHASLHTYPEYGACFVDLFTCGENCSYEKFDAALRAYLKPQRVLPLVLSRDKETHAIPR